jgi:hypothetical protein
MPFAADLQARISNRLFQTKFTPPRTLKEVADVLRHRSLNTTLIYAKLDSRNLVEVALPWPGSAS